MTGINGMAGEAGFIDQGTAVALLRYDQTVTLPPDVDTNRVLAALPVVSENSSRALSQAARWSYRSSPPSRS